MPVNFSMLLNLASAASADDKEVLWGFIRKYAPDATAESHPELDALAEHAVKYFQDHVKPAKVYRAADEREAAAHWARCQRGSRHGMARRMPRALQSVVYEVGREAEFEPMRDWFQAIYQVLLGATQGPSLRGVHCALRRARNRRADRQRLGRRSARLIHLRGFWCILLETGG